ncbi:MAG: hypothetical protein ACI85I_002788 [Arenicella sp.]|jgi:hypothetical protein
MRFLYISLLLLFFSIQSNAQILNIEKARFDNDTLQSLIGNAHLNMGLRQRNVKVFTLGGGYNMAYATKKHSFVSIGNINTIQVADNDVISEGALHLRANWLRKKKISIETFTQAQYDEARGLNHRFLGGVGGRVRLRYSDKLALAVGTGAMYEIEQWEVTVDNIDFFAETDLFKSTTYISIQNEFSDSFEINFITYYQARFNDFFKPRIFADINFNLNINKKFTFNTKFSLIYDSAPVVPIRESFYNLSNGISYSF